MSTMPALSRPVMAAIAVITADLGDEDAELVVSDALGPRSRLVRQPELHHFCWTCSDDAVGVT